MRAVPDAVERPPYVVHPDLPAPRAPRPVRNDPETIALMRRAVRRRPPRCWLAIGPQRCGPASRPTSWTP